VLNEKDDIHENQQGGKNDEITDTGLTDDGKTEKNEQNYTENSDIMETEANNKSCYISLENQNKDIELNSEIINSNITTTELKDEDEDAIKIKSYSDIDLLINKYTEKFEARQKIHEVRSVENRQSFFEDGRKVVEEGNLRIKNYHSGNNERFIRRGPAQRRMSTVKLKTFYDSNENIINITEDKYIKNKAEEIFGESLRSSDSKKYEYEFIPNNNLNNINAINTLSVIEDSDETTEYELKPSSSLSDNKCKGTIENLRFTMDNLKNNEETKDLNQLLIDEYIDEYEMEKEKMLNGFKDDNNLLNNDLSKVNGNFY